MSTAILVPLLLLKKTNIINIYEYALLCLQLRYIPVSGSINKKMSGLK